MGSVLNFEDIVETKTDVQFAEIPVPEWKTKDGKESLRIGSLTGEDMIEWTEANEGPAKKTAGIRLIIRSLVDDQGNRIGQDTMIQPLLKRNSAVLNRIVRAVLKLNGMDKAANELAKNESGGANTESSLSASQSGSDKVM